MPKPTKGIPTEKKHQGKSQGKEGYEGVLDIRVLPQTSGQIEDRVKRLC